jgi:hypothetical protein
MISANDAYIISNFPSPPNAFSHILPTLSKVEYIRLKEAIYYIDCHIFFNSTNKLFDFKYDM